MLPRGSYPIEIVMALDVDETKVEVISRGIKYHGAVVNNQNGSAVFLQVFFKRAADVTVGTTVPDQVIMVGATASSGWWMESAFFSSTKALTIALTGNPRTNDAPAGTCDVQILYEGT